MRERFRRLHRRWPVWLLFSALLLLGLAVLLMHRSYRGQIDASMTRLQQSVAAAQAQQARLAARLRAARTQIDPESGTNALPAQDAQAPSGSSEAVAARLQAVATELEQIAGAAPWEPSASAPAPALALARRDPQQPQADDRLLDWRQVRMALRELQHAINQRLFIGARQSGPRSTYQRRALQEWLRRSRAAANREDAATLAQDLMAIELLLADHTDAHPYLAPDLARWVASLRSAVAPGTLAPRQRQTLARLAQETAAIARALEAAPDQPFDPRNAQPHARTAYPDAIPARTPDQRPYR